MTSQHSLYQASRIWTISCLFLLIIFLLQTSSSPLLPCMLKDFSVNASGLAQMVTLFSYTYIGLQLPAGILIDRFGARVVLTLSAGIGAIACLIFAMSTHWYGILTARFFMGLAGASAFPGAAYLASTWFPERYFGFFIGATETIGFFGAAIGDTWLTGCHNTSTGWRSMHIMLAKILSLMAVLLWIFVRNRPSYHTTTPTSKPWYRQLFALLQLRQLWIATGIGSFQFAMLPAFAGLWCIPFLLKQYPSLSTTKAGIANSLLFWGVSVGAPIFGYVSDHLQRRRYLMTLGTGGCLVLFYHLWYGPRMAWPWLCITLFFIGVFASAYILCFAVVRDITPPSLRASAMGIANLICVGVGALIITPIIGYLLNQHEHTKILRNINQIHLSSFQASFTPLLFGLSIALVLHFFLEETFGLTDYEQH